MNYCSSDLRAVPGLEEGSRGAIVPCLEEGTGGIQPCTGWREQGGFSGGALLSGGGLQGFLCAPSRCGLRVSLGEAPSTFLMGPQP